MQSRRVKDHVERVLGRTLSDEEDSQMCAAGFGQFLKGRGSAKVGKAMQRAALTAAKRNSN